MRPACVAAFVLLAAILAPTGVSAALYACEVRDVKRVGAGGVPASDARTRESLRLHPRFTFDDRTGRIAGMAEDWVLSLLQKAVGQNALLAVSIHKGIGNTGLQILKIDTFEKDAMPFVWVSDDVLATGACTTGGD